MIEVTDIEPQLLEILNRHPQGIGEFDLLQELQQLHGEETSGRLSAGDSLDLFRVHFLLFHVLYRLRERLFAQQLGHLEIHVLEIRLSPWSEASVKLPAHHDPLREYYLDLNNLEQTTLQDVEDLLGAFWTRYLARNHRDSALAELGLEANADRGQIEQRYRKLAMSAHPDRGGDAARFQRIQAAMDLLRRDRD